MGLYDDVNYECKCPACGRVLKDFQSKDGPCRFLSIGTEGISNFYCHCRYAECGMHPMCRVCANLGIKCIRGTYNAPDLIRFYCVDWRPNVGREGKAGTQPGSRYAG